MHTHLRSVVAPESSPRSHQPRSASTIDSPAPDQTDLTALRQGDPAAYEAVFRYYYIMLCTFVVRLVGSWDDAEEVVQTVFSTLWQRHEQLHITTTLKTYLYSAVRNEALNSLKHRRVIDRAHHALAADEMPPAHAVAPLPPDLVLERDEVTIRVRAAVAALPPRTRDVLTLRWEHAMSYDEIGAVLGIQPRSAKMQQSRALAMLRKRLADLLPTSTVDEDE